MAFSILSGDFIEVRVNYLQFGQRLLNVFHYRMDGPGAPNEGITELQGLADYIRDGVDQWVTEWKTQASNTCTCTSVDAQVIGPTRRPFVRSVVGDTGSSESPAMPQNVQASITKVGETTGRHGIGRVEIPGLTVALTENGLLTAAGLDWTEALAPTILDSPSGMFPEGTFAIPIIFNRAAPGSSQVISGVRLQDTVRVARRRTVRVGK